MLTRTEFAKQYYPQIVKLTKDTGIFPQVMMAEMILESSSKVDGTYYPGESKLSKLYNNFFGIKADKSWKGAAVNLKTGEHYSGQDVIVTDAFRVYANPGQSIADYIKFLRTNPRYEKAGVFTASTPHEQAQRLKDAGYATDPQYAQKVSSVMDKLTDVFTSVKETVSENKGKVVLVASALALWYIFKK